MLSSELDADRNPVRGYVYGNEYISQNNGSSSGYYLNDEQGSIRYLTGSDGSIRNHYRYSAFGESITAEETVPNRLKYNAQMADELTGLYYLRARYYNASLGRFTQEDVIYNDGLNLYAYCNSNPVMYSDPSGFAKETCKSKVGGECDSESGRETVKIDEFFIDDWTGYPDAPKPDGPFRILEGTEYTDARNLANKTNANIHRNRPDLKGTQIHEMHPVKLGGSPTDIDNKIALSPKEHAKYTAFWNKVLREQKGKLK